MVFASYDCPKTVQHLHLRHQDRSKTASERPREPYTSLRCSSRISPGSSSSLGLSWSLLGLSLGLSWALLGCPGGLLGFHWGSLGVPLGLSWPLLGSLGLSWGSLGLSQGSLGLPQSSLEALLDSLGVLLGSLGVLLDLLLVMWMQPGHLQTT